MPGKFVIASGEQQSGRDLVNAATAELGITIGWNGTGLAEAKKYEQCKNEGFSVPNYHE